MPEHPDTARRKRLHQAHKNHVLCHASPEKRYCHRQIKDIVNNFDFNYFISCGPGYPGSESWSIKDFLPSCEIIGLEPQTQCFNNLQQKGFPGTLLNAAAAAHAGEREGFMGLEGGKTDFWLHGSEKLIEKGFYKKEVVCTTTVDKILCPHPEAQAFIWADIEGGELDMLKGAVDSMKNNKIVGFNLELRARVNKNDWLSHNGCTARDVIDFLKPYGFFKKGRLRPRGHKDYIFSRRTE
tara:strand:- start:110 stop:826 length:717 start_codon:yes stop_codon:yes gene_type:complete